MPALVAGIHVLRRCRKKDVDGRNKSGHDMVWKSQESTAYVSGLPGCGGTSKTLST